MTRHVELEEHYSQKYDEASRLSSSVRGRLELARVQDLLSRYLPPPPAAVVDIGGGPGVHAAWLRQRGYDVELIDLIARHVEQASAAGISAVQGDARRLPWDDEEFDAALMAGPMYHLPEGSERRLAPREAVRGARPRGLVAGFAVKPGGRLVRAGPA